VLRRRDRQLRVGRRRAGISAGVEFIAENGGGAESLEFLLNLA
jgi:hypothetical protein